MPKQLHNKILLLLSLTIILAFAIFGKSFRRPLDADPLGYYMYLPATFIYHNLKAIHTTPTDRKIDEHTMICLKRTEETKTPLGYTWMHYTMGMAVLETPFFFAAHAWEKMRGHEANGYAEIYYDAIGASSLFYALAGLWILFRLLRRYVSETHAVLTTITIAFATNLFWFTVFQPGMSHVPLFFLYAVLCYLTVELHARPVWYLFVLFGLTAGVIALVRPFDTISLLIPILYNVYNRQSLKEKGRLIATNIPGILMAVATAALVILPQLLYWKAVTGNYFYDTYADEHFNWKHPMIIEGLFFAKNGWLFYTPVMVFAIIGIFLHRSTRQWTWCTAIVLLVYVYLLYTWHAYNHANGFGSRPIVHLYPLLAISLAIFIQRASKWRLTAKAFLILLFSLFTVVNVSQSMQQGKFILLSEEGNAVYDLSILFKPKIDYKDLVVFDIGELQPDSSSLTLVTSLGCAHFDDSVSSHYVKDTITGKGYFYSMNGDEFADEKVSVKYSAALFKDARWVRCSGRFMYAQSPNTTRHMIAFGVEDIKWSGCKLDNKAGLRCGNAKDKVVNIFRFECFCWDSVVFWVKLPHHIPEGKQIALFAWNWPRNDLYVDDLCMELYK